MQPINVIGLGYIGLPTALMFAAHGVPVVGTDYNRELVATLQRGKTTFEEEGLAQLFQEAVEMCIRDRCWGQWHRQRLRGLWP